MVDRVPLHRMKRNGQPVFADGHEKHGGRRTGTGNKIPTLLKECILLAAELEGSDGKGKGGLIGFLRKVAKRDLRSFAGLIGRVLPLQIEARGELRQIVVYRSVEDVRADLAKKGISLERLQRVLPPPEQLQ